MHGTARLPWPRLERGLVRDTVGCACMGDVRHPFWEVNCENWLEFCLCACAETASGAVGSACTVQYCELQHNLTHAGPLKTQLAAPRFPRSRDLLHVSDCA